MAELVYKWDFASSVESWTLAPTGVWGAGYGEGDGGIMWDCITSGGGCSNGCITPAYNTCTRWSGTFEDLGIPAGSTITKFLHKDSGSNFTHMRTKKSGVGTCYIPRNGLRCFVDSTGFGYVNIHQFFTNHIPGAGWGDVNASVSSGAVSFASDDLLIFSFGHQLAIFAKAIGRVTGYLDEVQVVIEYTPPATSMQDIIPASGIIPVPR